MNWARTCDGSSLGLSSGGDNDFLFTPETFVSDFTCRNTPTKMIGRSKSCSGSDKHNIKQTMQQSW